MDAHRPIPVVTEVKSIMRRARQDRKGKGSQNFDRANDLPAVGIKAQIVVCREMLQSNPHAPGWRNWQTRETQNLVPSGECGFDSLSGHSLFSTASIDPCLDVSAAGPAVYPRTDGRIDIV